MLRPSNLFIAFLFLPLLLFSCQLNELPDSDPGVEAGVPKVMPFTHALTQANSCDLKGNTYQYNLSVTSNPPVGPQNMVNNFSYQLDLYTQPFQVGGVDGICPCKAGVYRIYFNTQAAANSAQLVNNLGQTMQRSAAQQNSSLLPGPWYIELTPQQIAIQFYIRFTSQTTPAPLMVHAGGYCIIDNIGGLGEPYTAFSPILVPTEDPGTGIEYNTIYFWPEEAVYAPDAPEFP